MLVFLHNARLNIPALVSGLALIGIATLICLKVGVYSLSAISNRLLPTSFKNYLSRLRDIDTMSCGFLFFGGLFILLYFKATYATETLDQVITFLAIGFIGGLLFIKLWKRELFAAFLQRGLPIWLAITVALEITSWAHQTFRFSPLESEVSNRLESLLRQQNLQPFEFPNYRVSWGMEKIPNTEIQKSLHAQTYTENPLYSSEAIPHNMTRHFLPTPFGVRALLSKETIQYFHKHLLFSNAGNQQTLDWLRRYFPIENPMGIDKTQEIVCGGTCNNYSDDSYDDLAIRFILGGPTIRENLDYQPIFSLTSAYRRQSLENYFTLEPSSGQLNLWKEDIRKNRVIFHTKQLDFDPAAIPETLPQTETISFISFRNNTFHIELKTPQNTLLLMRLRHSPNFSLLSDTGVSIPLYKVNGLLMAAYLPAHTDKLILRYAPFPWRWSIIAGVLFASGGYCLFKIAYRRGPCPEDAV